MCKKSVSYVWAAEEFDGTEAWVQPRPRVKKPVVGMKIPRDLVGKRSVLFQTW